VDPERTKRLRRPQHTKLQFWAINAMIGVAYPPHALDILQNYLEEPLTFQKNDIIYVEDNKQLHVLFRLDHVQKDSSRISIFNINPAAHALDIYHSEFTRKHLYQLHCSVFHVYGAYQTMKKIAVENSRVFVLNINSICSEY
jgi:hypothetical protein